MMEENRALAEINSRLAEVQARAVSQTAVVRLLDDAGFDVTAAERLLRSYMEALRELRRQRWVLEITLAGS